jgi:hypothetical protein
MQTVLMIAIAAVRLPMGALGSAPSAGDPCPS